MLFGFKNPLTRSLTADELLRAKKSSGESGTVFGAFLGASLLNRQASRLPLAPGALIRVTGHLETYAPNVANLLAKEAIPEHLSILLLDFQHTEEYWHRLWAAAFNLDRAKDFRLIDLDHEERSDYLGVHLPTNLPAPSFLRHAEKAFSVEEHLQKEKGLVATFAAVEHQEVFWTMAKPWLPAADLLLVFGWDELTAERRKHILDGHRASGSQRLVIVQAGFAADALMLSQATEVLFEQKAPLPQELWNKVRHSPGPDGLEKIFSKLTDSLSPLSMTQCLLLQPGNMDLVQTSSGDGLPWPPDYKPLRQRYPGN